MISCTEFTPAYSELFKYLDSKYGREDVSRLWDFLFAPTGKGIPLINYAEKDGLKGCVDYWTGTLSEEAADAVFIYNIEEGWFYSHMLRCPSKGRLLELKESIGLEPYRDYCDHCDYYRSALEKVGLTWIRNHTKVDEAQCSRVLWDPKVFKGVMRTNENTVTKEFSSAGTEYFHPDFHSSMNMCIDFVGINHGEEDIKEYLRMFTRNVYKPVYEAMKQDALAAIEAKIRETYQLEKAEEALTIHSDGNILSVRVAYCPAVRHLRNTGRDVSRWFHHTTESVMKTLAGDAGLHFSMQAYDEETGAAEYSFSRQA